jgi:biopolymer transport protein ExbB
MIVAIPALAFHRYFRGRIAEYIVDMEHEAFQLMDAMDSRAPAAQRVATAPSPRPAPNAAG